MAGFCPGVSPGRFAQGGGFGPMVRRFGYGVDQVIEVTMVTANSSIIQVDEEGD